MLVSVDYKKLQKMCDIKIAQSSLMGYGLYDACMMPIEEFIRVH
jgi:hypothetical protein